MHAGGVDMTGYHNGAPLCRSVQLYEPHGGAAPRITAAGVCKDAGRVEIGDELWGHARYDPKRHALDRHHGKPDPVMGSMGLYIGVD